MIEVKKYFAEWCAPCKMLDPVFDELKSQYSNINFSTVDIDEEQNLALAKGVRSVPTITIERDGLEVSRFVGVKSISVYQDALNSL